MNNTMADEIEIEILEIEPVRILRQTTEEWCIFTSDGICTPNITVYMLITATVRGTKWPVILSKDLKHTWWCGQTKPGIHAFKCNNTNNGRNEITYALCQAVRNCVMNKNTKCTIKNVWTTKP